MSTGKLPPPVRTINYNEDDEESDNEIESLNAAVEPEEPEEAEEAVIVAPPKPIFETFSTKTKLQSGICVVRELGGGKFELVNLSQVNLQSFSSEEIGRQIQKTPELLSLLDISKEDWRQLQLKSHQAVASAKFDLFRFLKLPIELRYRIYDFTIVASKPIRQIRYPALHDHHTMAFALAATCKQIHEETRKFFFRNNFRIDTNKEFKLIESYILQNVREVTVGWWGFSKKDPATFEMLSSQCPNLKVLNLSITEYVIDIPAGHHKYQRLYRNTPETKKFRTSNGFDALVGIRGLDRINVTLGTAFMIHKIISKEELDAFESFLNTIMTQPKPEPITPVRKAVPKASLRSLKKTVEKSSRTSLKNVDGEYRPCGRKR
ncbi:hypothetical protein LSUE1_G004834 [Lachnellula suecica]|uniref:F-box domain-containing protein n=1 Tax=Lachnellula suecica TaxID=602035 RepID=A0A8T9C2K9_9HELO|nr:hypothetical protein LSUE1_G004834 [Lachnellula suecica]